MEILNAEQLSRDCAEVFAAPVVAADRASGRGEKRQIARMAEPDGFASLIDKRERSDADVFDIRFQARGKQIIPIRRADDNQIGFTKCLRVREYGMIEPALIDQRFAHFKRFAGERNERERVQIYFFDFRIRMARFPCGQECVSNAARARICARTGVDPKRFHLNSPFSGTLYRRKSGGATVQ